jgi:acyl carrier protein
MTDDAILCCLTEILAHVLGEPGLVLRRDDPLRSLPGWNSFAELTLLSVAESRFGVSFAPADVADLQTVGDMVDLVARRQGRDD